MKTARDLLIGQDLTVISKTRTVYDAAKLMAERKIGAVPVLEGERVVGIFSERDIMNRIVAKDLNPQKNNSRTGHDFDLFILLFEICLQ